MTPLHDMIVSRAPRRWSPRWMQRIRLWLRRARERSELAAMSERELHDIGLTPLDVQPEANKPFWRD